MSKIVLGLVLSAPSRDNRPGRSHIIPGSISWALVDHEHKPIKKEYMQKVLGLTRDEVIDVARQKVGEYLKSTREERVLTLEDVSNESGLSVAQVKDIEAGKTYPVDDFFKMCRALDCYFFLEPKEGHHLDDEHMNGKLRG